MRPTQKVMAKYNANIHVKKDGQIVANIPEGITLIEKNDGPFTLCVNKNMCVNMEVIIESAIDIHYVFETFSEVKFIEYRRIEQGGEMNCSMDVKAGAKVVGARLNEQNHIEALVINEKNNIARDAHVEISYGEIADGDTSGTYAYELNEEGADVHLHVAAISRNKDRKHFEVTLNHHAPHTYGLMENYGVTRHTSRLTFDGVGRIDKGMHDSNSHQTSRIMVFEKGSIARANPYLFIDDYDVKASHAASVGAMNEDHLYYLQSRGLTKKQAMHLITLGYLLPAINVLKDEEIERRFEEMLLGKVGDE